MGSFPVARRLADYPLRAATSAASRHWDVPTISQAADNDVVHEDDLQVAAFW